MSRHRKNSARDGYKSWKRWIILFGLFLILFFEVGCLKSFGVFMSSITSDLHTTTGIVGFVVGLSHGITLCLSIISVLLLKRCSIRLLVMVGGFVGALGLISSSFASSVIQFALSMAISGLGHSLVIIPCQTSVMCYFPDHFEMAVAIVLLGGGFGMMVLPAVSERLMSIYGWRGAVFLLGALELQTMVTGAMIKPEEIKLHPRGEEPKLHLQEEENERLIDQDREGRSTYSPNAKEISQQSVSNYQRVCKIWSFIRETLLKTILQMIDLRLLREYPTFIPIVLINIIYPITYSGWVVFVIPNAISKGISPARAVYVAIAGGIANIVGRLVVGLLTSRSRVSPWLIFFFVSLVSAMAFFANVFASSLWNLCLLAFMNALGIGVKTVIMPIFCKEIVPQDRYTASLSLLYFIFGIMEGVGGLLIGLLYDVTKEFNIGFTTLGAINVVEAVLIMSPYLYKICTRRTLPQT